MSPGITDEHHAPLAQTTVVDARSRVGLLTGKRAANTPVSSTVAGGTTGAPSSGADAVALTRMGVGPTVGTAATGCARGAALDGGSFGDAFERCPIDGPIAPAGSGVFFAVKNRALAIFASKTD